MCVPFIIHFSSKPLSTSIPAIFSCFALEYMFLWFLSNFPDYTVLVVEAMMSTTPSRNESFDNNRVQIVHDERAVDYVKVNCSE